jgi:hypothetical protein
MVCGRYEVQSKIAIHSMNFGTFAHQPRSLVALKGLFFGVPSYCGSLSVFLTGSRFYPLVPDLHKTHVNAGFMVREPPFTTHRGRESNGGSGLHVQRHLRINSEHVVDIFRPAPNILDGTLYANVDANQIIVDWHDLNYDEMIVGHEAIVDDPKNLAFQLIW